MVYATLAEAFEERIPEMVGGSMYYSTSDDSPEMARNQEKVAPGIIDAYGDGHRNDAYGQRGTFGHDGDGHRNDGVFPYGNQSMVNSPDDGRSGMIGGYYDRSSSRGKNCSDSHCMTYIDHILSCDECVEKMIRLLNKRQQRNDWWMDLDYSQVVFWLILLLILMSMYDLLSRLIRRV